MRVPSVSKRWAPTRFPPAGRAEISERLRSDCRRVYGLQAEDSARFASATPALLDRLDPARRALIAMTCDHRFTLLFENWAASCDHGAIDVRGSTIVFATDEEARRRVEELGFVAYFDEASTLLADLTESLHYGDSAWVPYMYHQNWVVKELLALETDLLFQDVDVVWRRDPIPTLSENAARGVDVQAMYDGPNERFQPLYANCGFLYFRNSIAAREFWDQVYACHELIGYYRSQQEPANVLLMVNAHRGLEVVVLDEQRFANGHLYCGERTPPPDPWVVHHSWTGNLAQKLDRYAERGHWFLDEHVLRTMLEREASAEADAKRARAGARASADAAAERQREEHEAARASSEALLELLDRVRRDRDAQAQALAAMRRSTSWRVTAPLRRLKDVWRRRRG